MSASLLLGISGASTPNDALAVDDPVGWERVMELVAQGGIHRRVVFQNAEPASTFTLPAVSVAPGGGASTNLTMRVKDVLVIARRRDVADVTVNSVIVNLNRRGGGTTNLGEAIPVIGSADPAIVFATNLSNQALSSAESTALGGASPGTPGAPIESITLTASSSTHCPMVVDAVVLMEPG